MPSLIEHRHLETDTLLDEHHADVMPRQSVRIFGKHTVSEPVPFDLVFVVGDKAVHGSWNLIYVGEITSITAKTVTIKPTYSGKATRLTLARFIELNWDYDAERITRHNELIGAGL